MVEAKLFGKWDFDGIAVEDMGLKRYINISPRIVPKSGARYAGNRFHKSNVFIVERLINKIMVPGHKSKKHFKSSGSITGKSITNYNIVRDVFEILHEKTGENPVAVFVKAIENAAPREEVISIEYGGAKYPKAVECAPQRRVDLALRIMTQTSYHKSFDSKRSIVDTLADEILNAYNASPQSQAISKKNELERQADSAR